jgi:hypothetical protein
MLCMCMLCIVHVVHVHVVHVHVVHVHVHVHAHEARLVDGALCELQQVVAAREGGGAAERGVEQPALARPAIEQRHLLGVGHQARVAVAQLAFVCLLLRDQPRKGRREATRHAAEGTGRSRP